MHYAECLCSKTASREFNFLKHENTALNLAIPGCLVPAGIVGKALTGEIFFRNLSLFCKNTTYLQCDLRVLYIAYSCYRLASTFLSSRDLNLKKK